MWKALGKGAEVRTFKERSCEGTLVLLCVHVIVRGTTISIAYIPNNDTWELKAWNTKGEDIIETIRL